MKIQPPNPPLTSPMTRNLQHPLELLAPAGSLESFFAAMEAGADAVYCGLKEFSARAKAKNFSLEEMTRLTAYAHQHGRRLYVTLNTLLKETELPRLIEVLAGLVECRVDGVIIQDLGVWRLAHDHFPQLALHASTQMTVHNVAGVKMLEKMGFSRAVLARELSLAEIETIGKQTDIELEHFIHGALCYSVSGQCLFSSYLTGKSGNRGRCAQPCRRRLHNRDRTGFYFSTSDFCAIDFIPQLIAAGVMSFKIEGRMKSGEYVAQVVAAYRKVLDAKPKERKPALNEARQLLAQSYGRQTTSGFLRGSVPNDIILPERKGGIGRPLGTVEKLQGNAICLTTAEVVHVGDRLRVQPESDLAGNSFTVKELFSGKRSSKRAGADSFVRIPTPYRGVFKVGDLVYKVATGKSFSLSEEACHRLLKTAKPTPTGVALEVTVTNDLVALTARIGDHQCHRKYAVATEPATRSPLSRETLQRSLGKTATPALILESLQVKGKLPPVVIAPQRLKEIRRDLYAHLAETVERLNRERRHERIGLARAALLPSRPPSRPIQPRLTVLINRIRDLDVLADADGEIDRLILPLSQDNITDLPKQERKLHQYKDRLAWDIPPLIFADEYRSFQAVIGQLIKGGYNCFRLNNLGHFPLFSSPTDLNLLAGPLLYVLNSQANLALTDLGIKNSTLALEDDQRNMAEVLSRIDSAAITVYSPIPLVTSRIPMRGQRSGNVLETDDGRAIRLDFSSGLTVARSDQALCLSGRLEELKAMGGNELVVDLSDPAMDKGRCRAVLAAIRKDRPLANTTLFNFERGLE